MTKAELVETNKQLEQDKELLRDENAKLTAMMSAIRAILGS